MKTPTKTRLRHAATRFYCLGIVATGILGLKLSALAQSPPKLPTSGVFRDNKEVSHKWQITTAHTLMWDGAPYLPVGGGFIPQLFSDASEANWQKDVSTLETLKAKGVVDLILTPPKSLIDVKPAVYQRLLTYLDENGFQYGIAFGSGLTKPLSGLVVRPTVYRSQERGGLTAQFQITNTDGGLYLISDPDNTNKVVGVNYIDVKSDAVSIPLDIANAGDKLIVTFYPHKTLREGTTIPDLWSGYDEYRDQLIRFFSKVKPGRGLRFFCDPLAKRLGFGGDTDYLAPDSPAFRLEWEAYLNQTYRGSVDQLKSSWGLLTDDVKTVSDYANLVPLFVSNHGSPFFYDPITKTRHAVAVDARSKWWENYSQFRESSIQYYMNATADVLKSTVANVPVVYTWTQSHEIFLNREFVSGFDGLCAPAKSSPSLMLRELGPSYSEVTQANRSLWFIATEATAPVESQTTPIKPGGAKTSLVKIEASTVVPSVGFASAEDLKQSFEALLRGGAKGIFVANLCPDSNSPETQSWLETPAKLGWLHDFGQKLGQNIPAARYAPRLLYYPSKAGGAGVTGFIPNTSTLWLNSFYEGEAIDLWPAISGYRMIQDERQLTVLTSLTGKRDIHFSSLNARNIRVFTPDGTQIPFKIFNKSNFVLTLDTTPIIIENNGFNLLIEEPTRDILEQLDRLYSIGVVQKLPEIAKIRSVIDSVQKSYSRRDFDNAYILGLGELKSLTDQLQPYQWIEAEAGRGYFDFDEKVAHPEASGGYFFNLGNSNDPPQGVRKRGYGVSYDFDVQTDGVYNIWLAGSLPGPSTSNFVWRFDTAIDLKPIDTNAHGPKYLQDRFGWMLLGSVRIAKDKTHRVTIAVEARAQSPAIYSFAVDALMITPAVFHPNGIVKPLPADKSVPKRR